MWIRHDANCTLDPKWRRVERITGQSLGNILGVFWYVMERAQCAGKRGAVNIDVDDVETLFGIPERDTDALLSAFEKVGVLSDGFVVNWQKYQEPSTARSQKSKENSDLKSRERSGTIGTNQTSGTKGTQRTPRHVTSLEERTIGSLRSPIAGSDDPAPEPENTDFESEPEKPKTVDFDKQLFDEAVRLLSGKQMPDSGKTCTDAQARSLAGKLKKASNGSPWTALQAVVTAKTAADPVQYVLGAIGQAAKQSTTGPPNNMALIRDLLAKGQAEADAEKAKLRNRSKSQERRYAN